MEVVRGRECGRKQGQLDAMGNMLILTFCLFLSQKMFFLYSKTSNIDDYNDCRHVNK